MKKRLRQLMEQMSAGLIERDEPVRLALLAALAGEHLLLIGLPGTAKSVMARRLHRAFRDSRYFERLLTRFSVPEELFGPLSIKALEEDRYQRQTEHYLPSASIAFIDEVFKANSAILNALLTLLNEREFDNGTGRQKTPLITVVAASNELPEAGELDALYDRFLCRYEVRPVSAERFTDLLTLNEAEPAISPELALDDQAIAGIASGADKVRLSEEVLGLLSALREFLAEQGIHVSDRRWRKAVKLLRTSAHTNDRDTVSVWDCALLQHCLWTEPAQRAEIARWYRRHIGIGSGFNAARLEKIVAIWEETLAADARSKTQRRNERNEPLYLDDEGGTTTIRKIRRLRDRDGEALYLAPPDQADRTNDNRGYTAAELRARFFDDVYGQCHIDGEWQSIDRYLANHANRLVEYAENPPAMEPTVHDYDFISSRLQETGALLEELRDVARSLRGQLATLDDDGIDHLWVDGGFIAGAREVLEHDITELDGILTRLERVHDGYRRLPVREDVARQP